MMAVEVTRRLALVMPLMAWDGAIRKGAARLPGYGEPDVYYPDAFTGRWEVEGTVERVTSARELSALAALRERLSALEGRPMRYEARFFRDVDGMVIADRAFNERERLMAEGVDVDGVDWSPDQPNIVVVRAGPAVVETKVTRRAVERPDPGAFGYSEYCRVADAGSSLAVEVPAIFARRREARFRFREQDIAGLEIETWYDPTETGFGDLRGAEPALTVKRRYRLHAKGQLGDARK